MRVLLTTLHSKYIHPSLALPYLAGYCEAPGQTITIREFTLHEPLENVLALIHAEQPDVIGFSVYLWNRVATLQLIDTLHTLKPSVRIFVGGPDVSFDGAALLKQHPGLDAIVHGEGEVPVKALLDTWSTGQNTKVLPRITWRQEEEIIEATDAPLLADLDSIPSPFASGRVDLTRGFVYYETSRGCPYDCSFCMSALDRSVRSFSMDRIEQDLGLLLKQEVPHIKLVDRTFNYHPERTRQIFRFILANNRSSHLHFEIGAHLLDEETLSLLEEVPKGWFQFEIGVQSTLPETLTHIRRKASLEKLETNVRRLKALGTIEIHLDLIAGLPGENYEQFLSSIDRVAALEPDHLQIEPVKLLPGAPMRIEAESLGIRFNPHPPYTVLQTADLSFNDIERLRALSRLLDLSWNSHRLQGFLKAMGERRGSFAQGLLDLADWFSARELLRHPLSQQGLFEQLFCFLKSETLLPEQAQLTELLAVDYAQVERITPSKVPSFFNTALEETEVSAVKERVSQRLEAIKGKGIKLQYFAAVFSALTDQRQVGLFFYQTGAGRRRKIDTEWLTPVHVKNDTD